jgi:predicted SprT family Zn-dependent metalloprotease
MLNVIEEVFDPARGDREVIMEPAVYCCRCGAQYKVVRQEAPPDHNRKIACLSCSESLEAREGKFVLKYFRVKRPGEELRLR